MEKKKKFKLEMPSTCALLFMLTIFAAVLTWIIPAGEFDTEKVGNTTRVIAGTYHTIEQSPQGIWDILTATVTGFQNSAVLLVMIMFIGAAVHLLQKTGAIEVAFKSIAGGGKNANDYVIAFVLMLFMTIGGACGVFANPTVALVPIGIILSQAIGLDAATGMMLVYLGAYSGFNIGWANPSTLGVAHPIAELPVFSGMGVRVFIHVVNFIMTYIFVVMYMKRVRKDPTKSLNYEPGKKASDFMGLKEEGDSSELNGRLTFGQIVALAATLGSIVIVVAGSILFGWGNAQFAAVFLPVSIIIGLANGYGINGTTKEFIAGCSKMVNAGFIVGFANAISVVLTNGHILNTIVYYLSMPLSSAGSVVGANLMMVINTIINLFIPSGSGQAAVVMPLMVPTADLTGITRQVAVQAYQFGAGFADCVIPTAGTLMGSLGIAGIAWNRWVKNYAPLLAVQFVFAVIMLTILQIIGWTGL
mgnify:FL=1